MIGAFGEARRDTTHTRIAAPLACVALACLGAVACASGTAPTVTEGSATPSASGLDLVEPVIAVSALAELHAGGSVTSEPAPSAAARGANPSGSAQPAASAAPSAATKPDLASWLPPHEAACTTDADCAVTQTGASERFTCCDACGTVAGTKAWVAKVDRACNARRTKPGIGPCPPRDCGPAAARCVAGACALR